MFKASVLISEQAFDRIRNEVAQSKAFLMNNRAAMVQATVLATVPLAVIQHFGQIIPSINALVLTPGLAQYAKDQTNDPSYDVVAEFNTMRNAMNSARDSLIATFPKDGNGFILYQTINANGTIATRTFTSAQLAAAVALVDSVIASID